MAVYNFSLMSGYELGGVDSAQGFRCRALTQAGIDARFVFADFPARREFEFYTRAGIGYEQMRLLPLAFSDGESLRPTVSAEQMLQRLREPLGYDAVIEQGDYCILMREHRQVAGLVLDSAQSRMVLAVQYHNQLCLIRTDYYSDRVYCTEYISPISRPYGLEAKLTRRCYWNRDHSVAVEELMQEGGEPRFYFPDGSSCNRRELIGRYFTRLPLTERDTVIVDRPQEYLPQELLLGRESGAKIVTVFHSEHMYQQGCSTMGVGLNREYYYWFRHADKIDTMVVSTAAQQRQLTEDLRRYGCAVPEIRVIPAAGVSALRRPEGRRRPHSVLYAGRLEERKRVSWAVQAAIRAHEKDPQLTMDIYGYGSPAYVQKLQGIIDAHGARDYIRLMGFADLTQVYQQYELMVTTSLWETLGITTMEAAAAGCALLGFDVRYGNAAFIRDGENGFLVPYDPAHSEEACPAEVDELAGRMAELLSDEARLERFHRRSYEIAADYLKERTEQEWVKLVEVN